MTEKECYDEAARRGITDASAWDWNGWPNGCIKPEKDQFVGTLPVLLSVVRMVFLVLKKD